MQREWRTAEPAFDHYPDFCEYVHGLLEANGRASVGRPSQRTEYEVDQTRTGY